MSETPSAVSILPKHYLVKFLMQSSDRHSHSHFTDEENKLTILSDHTRVNPDLWGARAKILSVLPPRSTWECLRGRYILDLSSYPVLWGVLLSVATPC